MTKRRTRRFTHYGSPPRQVRRVLLQEIASCKRKRLFMTEEAAKQQAAKGYGITWYDCCFCGGWHLTKIQNWHQLDWK